MKFRTEYHAHPSVEPLNPESPVLLIGSCFSMNVGECMRECGWDACSNPTGVLYNPASIANILHLAMNEAECEGLIKKSMVERNGLWLSWLADSHFAGYDFGSAVHRMSKAIEELRHRLETSDVIIITFGTSWVYELRNDERMIVSNCHKFPSDTFQRRRMSVDEIVEIWEGTAERLRNQYGLKIIFTISPIRHLKDGFEGNSRSKAVLQLACEQIVERVANAEYFPAFEIMNDDLRDYRFYATDMVHPSEEGVAYIWEKFCDSYLSADSVKLLAEGRKINAALRHRPNLNDNSEEAQRRIKEWQLSARERAEEFLHQHPGMRFEL